MLHRLVRASGIETPTTADLIRFDRARRNKTLSNADWRSETDPAARIAKMKDGRTHLGYKPEHAVDLDSAVIVAAKIHLADQGDTQTLPTRWHMSRRCSISSARRRRRRPRPS